jgi:hypothetical protein
MSGLINDVEHLHGDGSAPSLEVVGDHVGFLEPPPDRPHDAAGAATPQGQVDRIGQDGETESASAWLVDTSLRYDHCNALAPYVEPFSTALATGDGDDEPGTDAGSKEAAATAEALDRPHRWTPAGYAAWVAHVRPRVAQPTKKRIPRPLYPEKVAQTDLLRVLRAIGRFVHRYGFWPQCGEIVALLRAHFGAVQYYLRELEEKGLIIHVSTESRRTWQMLKEGWTVLGLEPIEPWNPHPRRRMSRVARKILAELADIEAAERNARQGEPHG